MLHLVGAVNDKLIHVVQQVSGKLQHLLCRGREFGGAGGGLLDEFAHFIHGANDGLSAGSLFLHGRADFLGDFGKAVGGLGNLR